MNASQSSRERHPSAALWCDLALTTHLVFAVVWWWAMPAELPLSDPHFWVNTVLPWVLVVAVVAIRVIAPALRAPAVAALAAFWLGAAISARVVFPVSFAALWVAPCMVGVALGALWFREARRLSATGIAAAIAALYLGALLPMALRPLSPSTRPLGSGLLVPSSESSPALPSGRIALGGRWEFVARDATLQTQTAGRALVVSPLLTFDSRSPDGCWTLFASRAARRGPARSLTSLTQQGDWWIADYRDDDRSNLRIKSGATPATVEIEASSHLPQTVWSHLNTYTRLMFAGRGPLAIAFSPCPQTPIEVRAMDYPVGRPARCAYLEGGGTFRVVEASSAEKGPFHELASGRLSDDGALTMILHDDGVPIFRVTFHDWAAQCGRQRSPTAGWGVPVNAIEFSRDGAVAHIYVTLAATSVGRGFDSVGHAPGVYLNRMEVEHLAREGRE